MSERPCAPLSKPRWEKMVEHGKSAEQIAKEALELFIRYGWYDAPEEEQILEALEWAIHQARGF